MPPFKLVAPFGPAGDQPQAIDALVRNFEAGAMRQTLLGVTGSGKSVAWDEPVTVHLGQDRYFRGPIGKLIDGVLGPDQTFESVEGKPQGSWRVVAWDADSGESSWRPITAVSRHKAREALCRLTTACGRDVAVTPDHSVWILRDGELKLLSGAEVEVGDCLPVPLHIAEPSQPLTELDLLDLLRESTGIAVDVRSAFKRAKGEDAVWFKGVLKSFHISELVGSSKTSALRQNVRGYGVSPAAALALVDLEFLHPSEVRLFGKRLDAPGRIPLTEELAFVFGQFAAEGHAADRFALISTREPVVQTELSRCLDSVGIKYFRRPDGDFVIASKIWTDTFAGLMGNKAGVKRLPPIWPALSNRVLGRLLRGYFEGDGGIDGPTVSAVTLSRDLASDIGEALLRFGIWARIRAVSKKKPDGQIGHYFKISVSGADNLAKFQDAVGFFSLRKRSGLAGCLRAANTNVDLVPGVGTRLLGQRNRLGLLQREVAERAGCTRSMLSLVETGKRSPSRQLFERICRALDIKDAAFTGLSRVHWSPVSSVQREESRTPYVYDLSVEGFETFLTGRGGLFVHNTFSMAATIERLQRPALVMAHNKTLAAQLCNEFRELFPENAVEYFISYYDYYQPEAYIPSTDTYIEKTSHINDEIDRLRHSATRSLLERRDVIVVASVSCIFGLGGPEEYAKGAVRLRLGDNVSRQELLRQLVTIYYERNEVELARGKFRVRGDTIELVPSYEEEVVRVELFGDEIDRIRVIDPVTGELLRDIEQVTVFPAKHFVTPEEELERALRDIDIELEQQLHVFRSAGKLVEAQRLEQRTRYDIEMLRQVGFCNGVENYSRHLSGRKAGDPPSTLISYFPDDFVVFMDESHASIPQVMAMYEGDRSRKNVLVDFGFRLPSALDNRPLKYPEFWERVGQLVFVSATPGDFEIKQSEGLVVEQIIRPTGLVDPAVDVRPVLGQVDDLIKELRSRVERGERTLITTLTKRMAEDLTDYLQEVGMKVRYLHSEVKSLDRIALLRDLRMGVFDTLVGVNLLREGLDLPEVSLVAIMDADKEGFLRAERSLIQTIGRAARHPDGRVIMYADRMTDSMKRAIGETNRRRDRQLAFNAEHGITPKAIIKSFRNALLESLGTAAPAADAEIKIDDIPARIRELETKMRQAATVLEFETAAELRDQIQVLRDRIGYVPGKK